MKKINWFSAVAVSASLSFGLIACSDDDSSSASGADASENSSLNIDEKNKTFSFTSDAVECVRSSETDSLFTVEDAKGEQTYSYELSDDNTLKISADGKTTTYTAIGETDGIYGSWKSPCVLYGSNYQNKIVLNPEIIVSESDEGSTCISNQLDITKTGISIQTNMGENVCGIDLIYPIFGELIESVGGVITRDAQDSCSKAVVSLMGLVNLPIGLEIDPLVGSSQISLGEADNQCILTDVFEPVSKENCKYENESNLFWDEDGLRASGFSSNNEEEFFECMTQLIATQMPIPDIGIPGLPGLDSLGQIPGIPSLDSLGEVPELPNNDSSGFVIPSIPSLDSLLGQIPGMPNLDSLSQLPGFPNLEDLNLDSLSQIPMPLPANAE